MTPPIPAAPSSHDGEWMSRDHPHFARYVFFSIFLLLFGGIMSGLQQATMQLRKPQLTAMLNEGTEAERKVANILMPLVQRAHLTLVALLVGNAFCMEALPVVMDELMPKGLAIALSVTGCVLFGEVIPQAICLRWPMELCAFFSWLLYILIAVLYPVIAPIAWGLDKLFGSDERLLSRAALRELAILHASDGFESSEAALQERHIRDEKQRRAASAMSDSTREGEADRLLSETGHSRGRGPLLQEEVQVILGALDLHKQTAGSICIPLYRAKMISMDARLDQDCLRTLANAGHSRIPVHPAASAGEADATLLGLLLVRQLVRLSDAGTRMVRDLDIIHPILVVRESCNLFALLLRFCKGESHMAAVVLESTPKRPDEDVNGIRVSDPSRPGSEAKCVVGILTLEDVLEKLLRKEIRSERESWEPAANDLEARLLKLDALKQSLLANSLSGASVAVSAKTNTATRASPSHTLVGGSSKRFEGGYGSLAYANNV